MREKQFIRNQMVFKEGDENDSLYFIKSGEFRVLIFLKFLIIEFQLSRKNEKKEENSLFYIPKQFDV